jgi:hypothetical protein
MQVNVAVPWLRVGRPRHLAHDHAGLRHGALGRGGEMRSREACTAVCRDVPQSKNGLRYRQVLCNHVVALRVPRCTAMFRKSRGRKYKDTYSGVADIVRKKGVLGVKQELGYEGLGTIAVHRGTHDVTPYQQKTYLYRSRSLDCGTPRHTKRDGFVPGRTPLQPLRIPRADVANHSAHVASSSRAPTAIPTAYCVAHIATGARCQSGRAPDPPRLLVPPSREKAREVSGNSPLDRQTFFQSGRVWNDVRSDA